MSAAADRPNRHIFITQDARLSLLPPQEGRPVVLSGYAIVWNALSTDRGGYKVRLLPGSARFATPTMALFHHEWRDILGNTDPGTLRLFPDGYGVRTEIDLPDTTVGRDVATLVARRDLKGMSFAMVDDPTYTESVENGVTVRNASAYLVDEVTITAAPAFTQATVGIRAEPPTPAPEAMPPPIVVPAYARTAQAHVIDRFRFDMLRLTGETAPRRAV